MSNAKLKAQKVPVFGYYFNQKGILLVKPLKMRLMQDIIQYQVVCNFQEDDILREQIGIHGIDSWAIVASKFKDKTTRQCRRRWFTYLNSDFKKGGWS